MVTARALVVMLLGVAGAARGDAETRHPIHSTITEIAVAHATARLTIRVFADDFGRAVSGLPAAAGAPDRVTDSAAFAYVTAHLRLSDAAGATRPLRWCGMERRADAYVLCLAADGIASLDGLRIENRLHTELYADQINVVQASAGAARAAALFMRGDGPKTLRR